jgi:hypothetical protein
VSDALSVEPAEAVRIPHTLHGADRTWVESNCALDLWIELLHHLELEPLAAFGCAVRLDFEGDQYTFLRIPGPDLEALYGIEVQELAIWRPLLDHALEQSSRGRVVMPEVDAWFLPDTRGTSYRQEHVKTTLAIDTIDPEARRLTYFHNAGRFALEGEDFDGVFGIGERRTNALPLFVEIAKLERVVAHPPAELARRARILLDYHVARRPRENPIASHRARVSADLALLRESRFDAFHQYAFATVRQLGACFGLLGAHLRWLEQAAGGGLHRAAAGCEEIETTAKVLEFTLARAVAAGRTEGIAPLMERLERTWDEVMAELVRTHGY